MTFAEIARNLPSDLVRNLPASRDLLHSAVLALRPQAQHYRGRQAGSLALGIALGAGIALLCAPQAGRELRRQLSARLDGAMHPQRIKDLDDRESTYARAQ